MNTNVNWVQQDIAQELAVLKEWNYLQQSLFDFALVALHSPAHSWRSKFEDCIAQITVGRVQIWWEPYTVGSAAADSRLLEIRYQQIRYGMLELTSGYLASRLLPGIPQNLAHLCTLLLALAEYEELVQHELTQLSPLSVVKAIKPLTARERDVLHGLVRGESETEIAHRLGIEPTTVHTHLRRLYHKLEVHSPKEAVLRGFVLRLVDWLDMPR